MENHFDYTSYPAQKPRHPWDDLPPLEKYAARRLCEILRVDFPDSPDERFELRQVIRVLCGDHP